MGAIAGHNKDGSRNEQKRRAEQDEAARLLRSQLAAARSQLEQKEIVTRSLQRQLDQVSQFYITYSSGGQRRGAIINNHFKTRV